MLTVIRHLSVTVAIDINFFNIMFATEKHISVSPLTSKIIKGITFTLGNADLTTSSYLFAHRNRSVKRDAARTKKSESSTIHAATFYRKLICRPNMSVIFISYNA
jgi:hypothetical protein